ncbi:MAG: hypothetical protein HYZ28_02235 [Myxococcales bacterium]|nr:hypothetical protein [Myxococcales bacterium]
MEYQPNFPRTLEAFKQLVADRLFNVDKIDEAACAAIIEKINRGDYSFSKPEVDLMRRISNIGDVNTCDTDHRVACDGQKFTISKT